MTDRTALDDWELLSRVAQAYRTISDTFMEQADTHRAQGVVLCHLFVQDGVTQTEIGERLGVQGATVTNMLQRMEEASLIVRRRDAEDNRLVRVYLTDEGRMKERALNEQFVKLEATIFEGFDEAERVLMRRLLKQLLQNMGGK
ncbi:MAG: MarR family transcriptional regulator [Burkholderiales bacterium]|nr:MarR family transcriptional regulator [Anaerolineae bacterium]